MPALRPRDALGLYLLVATLFLFLGYPLQSQGLVGIMASEWLFIALPVVAFAASRARATGGRWTDLLALRRPPARVLVGALLIGVSIWYVLAWLVLPIQERIAPLPPELRRSLEEIAAPGTSPLLTLATVSLTPAVCEELLCRSSVARALRAPLGPAGAVLVSALLFGVLHLSPYRFVPTFLLGISLGAVVLASESVYPAMIIHALNNGAVILLTGVPGAARTLERYGNAFGMLAIALLVLGHSLALRPQK